MQIQCPHCKSRYHLGSETVDAYGGFVRCGNCNYKFNIHDQAVLDEGSADLINTGTRPNAQREEAGKKAKDAVSAHAVRVEPRLDHDEREDQLNIRFDHDGNGYSPRGDADSTTNYGDSDIREPQMDLSGANFEDDVSQDFTFPENFSEQRESEAEHGGSSLEVRAERVLQSEAPDLDPVENIERSLRASETDEARVEFDAPEGIPAGEAHVDEGFSSLTLVNDDSEGDEAEPGFVRIAMEMLWRSIQFIFWAAVAVALAYLLFSQIKERLYPAYKNHSMVQNARAALCRVLPCNDASYNIELFEIVVSRMDEINDPARQLHISIFLLNKAEQTQAYPNILLTLEKIDGSIAGQRVITPQEYFTSYDSLISSKAVARPGERPQVKPNKLGKILIKLNNPPADAVGFEARVVQ